MLGSGSLNNQSILYEVKQLHNTICQLIFELNKDNSLTKHPSPLQMRIIKYLIKNREEDVCQKDIQESLNISKAAISLALQAMENKGIIKRVKSLDDGRRVMIKLTDKGISTFDDIEKDMIEVNKRIEESITKDEMEEFIRISHKIKENIRKEV